MFRPDVTDINNFYSRPLGMAACRIIRQIIRHLMPNPTDNTVQQVVGIGYPLPYLLPFMEQERNRVGAVMPAGQGVIHWPRNRTENITLLGEETELPFQDQSIDKALIIHSLEFTEPKLFLPEVWRVLAPGGEVLFVVPGRSGCWSRAEKTPFGHGRPYSALQLEQLLKEALFVPIKTTHALFLPPTESRFILRLTKLFERIGQLIGLPFGGVVMVLAEKRIHAPINGNKVPVTTGFAPTTSRALFPGLHRQ